MDQRVQCPGRSHEGGGRRKVEDINAEADAWVLTTVGQATAEKTRAVGKAEAEVIRLKTSAVGQSNYALIEVGRALAESRQQLVPQIVAGDLGAGGGGSRVNLLIANLLKGAAWKRKGKRGPSNRQGHADQSQLDGPPVGPDPKMSFRPSRPVAVGSALHLLHDSDRQRQAWWMQARCLHVSLSPERKLAAGAAASSRRVHLCTHGFSKTPCAHRGGGGPQVAHVMLHPEAP